MRAFVFYLGICCAVLTAVSAIAPIAPPPPQHGGQHLPLVPRRMVPTVPTEGPGETQTEQSTEAPQEVTPVTPRRGVCFYIRARRVCTNDPSSTTKSACPPLCQTFAAETPICGSDGKTYAGLCAMEHESCLNNEKVEKVSDGECPPQKVPTIGSC